MKFLLMVIPVGLLAVASTVNSESTDDTVRVTVTVNADGSRTAYRYDNTKHEAIATTTEPDGKARSKVVYRTDNAGRFESGIVYGADGKFQFKTVLKYDSAGRLEREEHLDKADAIVNKIVYKYDPAGKQIGYSTYDAAGKLISGSAAATPSASHKTHGH
jgi:hypothetical protein